MSRETVAQGGSANLAETAELIGAESYVLAKVRDRRTAEDFIRVQDRFQQWAGVHGHSAEGNPSGGNMYRGLYNIVIKSIGAARKKDPATRLDYVIDFGERMREPGFYFMDSPGNDLESIAGQVAAGCNMILFATGNGSITNFPFVPTIKVMTTTRRFELVRNEMDFNAGRYQDGEALEDLGQEAIEQMIRIASGERSAGERAGRSQVQLWREWRNNEWGAAGDDFEEVVASAALIEKAKEVCAAGKGRRLALVLPTSLCSGQIAVGIAEKLNARARELGIERAVALPHTEGCGNSIGESERLFLRTMAGYLAHPFVTRALLLEHGCEKTHNDAFRNVLRELEMPEQDYDFRSVQLDGGIESVTEKSVRWFTEAKAQKSIRSFFGVGLYGREMSSNVRVAFAMASAALVKAGGAVVSPTGRGEVIGYGERVVAPGLYRMECPTDDSMEIVTGLGAAGVEMIVGFVDGVAVPGNPVVPTLRVGVQGEVDVLADEGESSEELALRVLQFMISVKRAEVMTVADRLRDLGFQITRGREGISL
jgi:altronate dehydratase